MPKRTRFSLLLSLVLAAMLSLAFVACGNDDDGATTPTPDTNGTPADTPTPDETDDNGDDTNGNGTDDGTDDEDGLDALRRAAEAGRQQPFSITYEMEFEGDTIQMVINSDPPRYAMRIEGDLGDGEGVFISIYDGEDSYLCTEGQGESSCLKFSGEGGDIGLTDELFFSSEEILQEIADDGADVRPAAPRTIAGQAANCYDVSSPEGEGLICVSRDADIALLIEGTFEGEFTRIEVVNFSNQPDQSAFEPPYEVVEIS